MFCLIIHISSTITNQIYRQFFKWKIRGCPRDAMVYAMDCEIVACAITFTFGQIPPYPPSYELNSTNTVLQEEWPRYQITHEG